MYMTKELSLAKSLLSFQKKNKKTKNKKEISSFAFVLRASHIQNSSLTSSLLFASI